MSEKQEKKIRELEKEIRKLQRKLEQLYQDGEVEKDEVAFVKPLPPLPPKPPKTHKRGSIYDDDLGHEEGPIRIKKKSKKKAFPFEREPLYEELRHLRQELNEREREYRRQKQEFERIRREIREKERMIREKEREFRKKSYGSYSFDINIDEDVEGIANDLEERLGEYTRSILTSVAESLKSSLGIVIDSGEEIGKGLKDVGSELGKLGQKIGTKISNEFSSIGRKIPEDKLEEFYEVGATIVSAIGDPNRLRILKQLEKGPMYQKELSEVTNLRGGTFKHHMDKLIDDKVKFVTQEVVRGRYVITTRGREALKLAEIQFLRYLEEQEKRKSASKSSSSRKGNSHDDEEFDVKIR